MIKPNNNIIQLALSYGFSGAEFLMKWKGYNVFKPTCKDGNEPCIGQPIFILQRNGSIRVSTNNESDNILELIQE